MTPYVPLIAMKGGRVGEPKKGRATGTCEGTYPLVPYVPHITTDYKEGSAAVRTAHRIAAPGSLSNIGGHGDAWGRPPVLQGFPRTARPPSGNHLPLLLGHSAPLAAWQHGDKLPLSPVPSAAKKAAKAPVAAYERTVTAQRHALPAISPFICTAIARHSPAIAHFHTRTGTAFAALRATQGGHQ